MTVAQAIVLANSTPTIPLASKRNFIQIQTPSPDDVIQIKLALKPLNHDFFDLVLCFIEFLHVRHLNSKIDLKMTEPSSNFFSNIAPTTIISRF